MALFQILNIFFDFYLQKYKKKLLIIKLKNGLPKSYYKQDEPKKTFTSTIILIIQIELSNAEEN